MSIYVSEKSIREAWIELLLNVLEKGNSIKTEYDNKEDPPSKDATVMIDIKNPFNNPIMRNGKPLKVKSKYGKSYDMYGEIGDVFLAGSIMSGYIEEMLEGINDHLIIESPTSYPYSYHHRLFKYIAYGEEDRNIIKYGDIIDSYLPIETSSNTLRAKTVDINHFVSQKPHSLYREFEFESILPFIDQIDLMTKKLKKSPYSRRAQSITWRPMSDPFRDDPPCLQRIWCRVINGKLTMQTSWRSRDLFKAWQSNVNGIIRIQKNIAEDLGVEIGNYIEFNNSLHIYGKDMKKLDDMFLRMLNKDELKPHHKTLIKKRLSN